MRDHVPELDGIRALAVAAVVALHASDDRFPVGWAGVDVFFVLSGYLITGLLLREVEQSGRVDLLRFYIRRAARLYPALIVAVVLALSFGARPGHALIALAYLTDISRAIGHDTGLLGHTWSLSIEEHFYLVWPLVVIAGRTRRRVAWCAGVAGVASLAAMMLTSPPPEPLGLVAYNAPHARAWELLAGAVLACLAPSVRVATVSGVVLVAGAAVGYLVLAVQGGGWPGMTAAVALVAVMLAIGVICLVAAGRARFLAWWPLPQVGAISYGVYLYHHVIFRAAPFHLPGRRLVTVAAWVAVTLAVAWASHRWVETPIRTAGRRWSEDRPAIPLRTS